MRLYSVSYCFYGERIIELFKELIAANICEHAVISVSPADTNHPVFRICIEVKSYDKATIKQVIEIFSECGITEKEGLVISGFRSPNTGDTK